MLLADREIKYLVDTYGMISPFVPHQVREVKGLRVVSYGLSSTGYDIRLGYEFKLPKQGVSVLDPHNNDESMWQTYTAEAGEHLAIPANSFVLARSLETFNMPHNIPTSTDSPQSQHFSVSATCVGKSTYARLGLIVNVTPLETGWQGVLTLELNTANHPVKVYAGEGIAQLLFWRSPASDVSYADKGGKYQNQTGVTIATL